MIREYIIKVDEDKKDIMGDCPLVEKPKELVRCKDCKYHDEEDGKNFCDCGDRPDDWFCADGREDGDGE